MHMNAHCLLVAVAIAGSAAAADRGPLEPFGFLAGHCCGAWEPFGAGEYSMVRR